MMSKYGTGAIKDIDDSRDYVISATRPVKTNKSIFHEHPLPIRSQGPEGTCVAHAVTRVKEWYDVKQGRRPYQYSPRHLYYHCKLVDNYQGEGTFPRVALNQLQVGGVSYESDWPYKPYQQDVPDLERLKPIAYPQKIFTYARINNAKQMIANLLMNGPFVVSLPITDGWITDSCLKTGIVDTSVPVEPKSGLHLITCDGYDHKRGMFRMSNSWGPNYGDRGKNWIPKDWVDTYFYDAWAMTDDTVIDSGLVVTKP